MARKFALLIGSDTYTDDDSLSKLGKVEADVKGLSELLTIDKVGGFDTNTYGILHNRSSIEVLATLEDFFNRKKMDDLLLLYFAGHGITDDYGNLYFSMINTKRSRLLSTSIPASSIYKLMNDSKSKRQIIILDCCHGGAFVKGTRSGLGDKVPLRDMFKEERIGYARVVISSTTATQFAFEDHEIMGSIDPSNSVFTHHLIQGLRTGEADLNNDGYVSIDELFEYTHDQVVAHSDKQTPEMWVFGQNGNALIVAKNAKLAEVEAFDSQSMIPNPIEGKPVETIQNNLVLEILTENPVDEKVELSIESGDKISNSQISEEQFLLALKFVWDHLKLRPGKRSDRRSIISVVSPVFDNNERLSDAFVEQALMSGMLEEAQYHRFYQLSERARATLSKRR
jgi:hypothetical protein